MIPWEGNFVIPGFVTLSRFFGAGTFVLGVIAVVVSGRIRRWPLELYVLGLFVAWSGVSVLWSESTSDTIRLAQSYSLLFVFVWLIWEFADTFKSQIWLFRMFIVGIMFPLASAVLRLLYMDVMGVVRVTAETVNSNTMALSLVVATVLTYRMLSLSRTNGWKSFRIIDWGLIPVFGIGVLLTASRSGAIGMVALVAMIMLTSPKMGWKPAIAFLMAAAIGGYFFFRLIPEANIQRVMEGRAAGTLSLRLEIWRRGIEVWMTCPLQGCGAGAFVKAVGMGYVAHNTFVTILVENGLIGLSLWLGFWALLFRRVLRLPATDKYFWITIFVAIMPSLLSMSENYGKILWFLWAVCLSQSDTIRRQMMRRPRFQVFVSQGMPPPRRA